MRILIVGGTRDLQRTLSRMIFNWGGEPHCVHDARTGLGYLARSDYDYVLLEVALPDHNGRWFMERARMPATTCVVAMDGFIPETVLRDLYDLGVSDYLEMPFREEDLLNIFMRHGAPRRAPDIHTILAA